MDPANGASGANGTAGQASQDNPAGPDWAAFSRSLDQFGAQVTGSVDAMRQDINAARQESAAAQEVPEAPVNLDELSREGFAAHIVGTMMDRFESKLNEVLAPVIGTINNMQNTDVTRTVTADIKALQGDEKAHFDDWKADMAEASKLHPTMSIPQLYGYVRGMNPGKVAELEKKYNPPTPTKPRGFGGLVPSAVSTKSGENEPDKLTGREATIAAAREVIDRNPVLEGLLTHLS